MLFVTIKINTGVYSMYNVLFASLLIIIPVQFVFIISMLYCFYFTARAIKSNELNQNIRFDAFYKEFILIMLFPFGIWKLQPVINEEIGISGKLRVENEEIVNRK